MNTDKGETMDEHIRVVEINGVKVEIDLRQAKRVDAFKVGDPVKLLVKDYGSKYESLPGVIVSFDEYKNLPTIVVMYIKSGYSEASIKFAYINAETEDSEIVHAHEDELIYDRERIMRYLDNQIAEAENNTDKAKQKKAYFVAMLGKHFADFSPAGDL